MTQSLGRSMNETLEGRLKEAEKRYRDLQEAKGRKDSAIKCPSLDRHELKNVQVVFGGDTASNVHSITGIDWVQSGYQIWFCLACGAWVIAKYTGELVSELSEEQAKKLAFR